ncbi:MAG: MarR family winged helix-turn-helix transcriptional regulator [Flavobacteriaceae bacterium]
MNVEEVIKTEKRIPLKSRTVIHIILVYNKLNEVLTKALRPYEVSLQQFNVLRILRGRKGVPANLSTLNERMVSKMSNTTRLVDKLMHKGFVQRIVCESNRRKVEITITTAGEEVLLVMDKIVRKAEDDLVKNFSRQELEELNLLLHKF